MISRITPSALRNVVELPERTPELVDAGLVRRALAFDRSAEHALYVRHVGYITNLCLRLLGHREDAEDAAQDAFVSAFGELATLREPERFRPWLARLAVHKVHRRFRKRRLLRALGLYRADPVDFSLLPARASVSPELAAELERLGRVLATLSDGVRAAWVLRYVDGMKLEEVAAHAGCSLATIKRRIAAADETVRAHVTHEEVRDA